MATDSPLTTLLENIETNLNDSAVRHTGLAGLNHTSTTKHVVAQFAPSPSLAPPYALIQPGAATKSGEQSRRDTQTVLIHVVHGVYDDFTHYYSALGTGSLDGALTLSEEIEAALVRPAPYNDGDHVTANGYTTQANVLTCFAESWSELGAADAQLPELYVVHTLTLTYLIEKGT